MDQGLTGTAAGTVGLLRFFSTLPEASGGTWNEDRERKDIS